MNGLGLEVLFVRTAAVGQVVARVRVRVRVRVGGLGLGAPLRSGRLWPRCVPEALTVSPSLSTRLEGQRGGDECGGLELGAERRPWSSLSLLGKQAALGLALCYRGLLSR